ncbi:MAG: hypothetical protein ACK5JT_03780 [Hyphomicrobiaceae bacterium]
MARYEASSHEMVAMAAQAGMPDALYQLGLMYCSGHGVELDLVEAHKWFNLAAMRGNAEARRYRREISAEMSRREIGDAQRRAREWKARG